MWIRPLPLALALTGAMAFASGCDDASNEDTGGAGGGAGSGTGGSGAASGGGAGGETCANPDGSWQGPWQLDSEDGPCETFPPWDLMADGIVYTISQTGARLDVQTFGYDGDFADCVSSFSDRQPGAVGSWTFDYSAVDGGGTVDSTFTLERQQTDRAGNNTTCTKTWRGALSRVGEGDRRPIPDTDPVAPGGQVNAWGLAFDPRLHVSEDGGTAVITWQEWNNQDGTPDLLAREWAPGSGTFGPTKEVDANDTEVRTQTASDNYQLAGSPSGRAVAVWIQEDPERINGGFPSAWANVFEPGSGFGGAVPIENIQADDVLGPAGPIGSTAAAAADGPDGFMAVAAFGIPARGTLYAAEYANGAWAPARPILDGFDYVETAALGSTGAAAVVTLEQDQNGARSAIALRDAGGTWSPVDGLGILSADGHEIDGVEIVALGSGRFLVVAGWDKIPRGMPNESPARLRAWVLDGGGMTDVLDIPLETVPDDVEFDDEIEQLHVRAEAGGGAVVALGTRTTYASIRFDGTAFEDALTRFGGDIQEETAFGLGGGHGVFLAGRGTLRPQQVEQARMRGENMPTLDPTEVFHLRDGSWARPDIVFEGRWGSMSAVAVDGSGAAFVALVSQNRETYSITDVLVNRLD